LIDSRYILLESCRALFQGSISSNDLNVAIGAALMHECKAAFCDAVAPKLEEKPDDLM
jgi:hypothetical protein